MNEKQLVWVCLIGSIIGITTLYFIVIQIHSEHVNIGEINQNHIGKSVNLTGKVVELRISNGHLFFDLQDETGRIKVILWNDTLELLEMNGVNITKISNNAKLNIIGSVQLYKGELEVIPIREQVKLI
jgi:DNA/RNA endonuclease YhcR with UshA esterase domain